jgi:hypothetical protein
MSQRKLSKMELQLNANLSLLVNFFWLQECGVNTNAKLSTMKNIQQRYQMKISN